MMRGQKTDDVRPAYMALTCRAEQKTLWVLRRDSALIIRLMLHNEL